MINNTYTNVDRGRQRVWLKGFVLFDVSSSVDLNTEHIKQLISLWNEIHCVSKNVHYTCFTFE